MIKNEDQLPRRNGGFSAGFFFGFFAGAILVFLYTTREGQKIRQLLSRKGSQLIDDLPDLVSDLEKKGNEFSAKVEKVKKEFEDNATHFSHTTKEKIKDSLKKLEVTQNQGQKTIRTLRRRFFTKNGHRLQK